jgi:hypothetical protein
MVEFQACVAATEVPRSGFQKIARGASSFTASNPSYESQ